MDFIDCEYKGNNQYSCNSKTSNPLIVITKEYNFGPSLDNRNMIFNCNTDYTEFEDYKKNKFFKYKCNPNIVITNEKYNFKNNIRNFDPEKDIF
jgi:hypothetical protein